MEGAFGIYPMDSAPSSLGSRGARAAGQKGLITSLPASCLVIVIVNGDLVLGAAGEDSGLIPAPQATEGSPSP